MKINKSKGFTIIELLVVVAIIAVLTGIVLVNVTSYLNKGKDAAAQGNLATLLVNGAVWNDSGANPTGTYNLWITNGASPWTGAAGAVGPLTAITQAGYTATATCNVANCAATSTAWCACVPLKANANTFCVDSTGQKKTTATACGTECAVATGLCL